MKKFVSLPKLACTAPVLFLFALCDELSFHFMLLVGVVARKTLSDYHHERSAIITGGVRTGKSGTKNRGRRGESESESEREIGREKSLPE